MNENLKKLLKLEAEIQEMEDLAKDFRSKSLHNKAKAKEFKKLSRWLLLRSQSASVQQRRKLKRTAKAKT